MTPESLLRHLVEAGGSDLILRTNGRPSMRVDGRVRFLSDMPVPPTTTKALFAQVLNQRQQEVFFKTGEADTAHVVPNVGRFRVNVFRLRGKLGFVFRHVKPDVPTLAELHLPEQQLVDLASQRRGMLLVTGIAGSGKSTTLASMIKWLNTHEHRHIVTLEDPIEYVFEDDTCMINQREVGKDTLSFHSALKHVVRQAPDVIMVGEMRDRETVEATIQAAETGHLVMSTLHTVNAIQTIERIMSFFEPHHHPLIRLQLSMLVKGIVSQRLIPKTGGGRVPAIELLLSTPSVKDLLAEGRTRELEKAISEGSKHFGTMTFNQSLAKLINEKKISAEDAMAASDRPEQLHMELRGISKGGGGGGASAAKRYQPSL